ncbi:LPXTG cell wall anchor domain-containing protein [Staphylococcus condimenti]|nr:LPXTG cell wall anchor domain-containing protein [Staphylococcus condimenti]
MDNDGRWTVDVEKGTTQKKGDEVTANETDEAGNTSTDKAATVTDTQAPDAPVINPVNTGDNTVTGTGEPGGTVTVTFPDGSTVTSTVGDDGTWTADVPEGTTLNNGDVVTATETDGAGNTSQETSTTVTDNTQPDNPDNTESPGETDNPGQPDNSNQPDTQAPDAPIINPVNPGDNTVTGTGEPDGTVTVTFPDGSTATSTVGDDGTWTADVPEGTTLKDGDVVTATETDGAGNTSKVTSVTVLNDGQPAEPSNHTPSESGQTPNQPVATPDAPVVNPVPEHAGTVTGTATPGNKVEVTLPNGTVQTTEVNQNGQWTISVPTASETLEDGAVVTATEISSVGNTSQVVRTEVNHGSSTEASQKRNGDKALPETGETDNVPTASLFGTLFAVLGSIFLFWRRRKEEDEEQ